MWYISNYVNLLNFLKLCYLVLIKKKQKQYIFRSLMSFKIKIQMILKPFIKNILSNEIHRETNFYFKCQENKKTVSSFINEDQKSILRKWG